MIHTLLLCAMVVLALFQRDVRQFYAAGCFVGCALLHSSVLGELDGLAYYGSGALFDLLVITLLAGIYPVPKMVTRLQLLSLVSIVVNGLGYWMWYAYWAPTMYNAAFIALYLWSLMIMTNKDGDHVGVRGADSWRSCFRFYDRAKNSNLFKHGGKA